MKCVRIKDDGNPCGAFAIKDSEFCYTHSDPENAREMGRKSTRPKVLDLQELNREDFDDFEDYVISMYKSIKEGLDGLPFTPDVARALTNVVDKTSRIMVEKARTNRLEALPYRIIWDDGKTEFKEELEDEEED